MLVANEALLGTAPPPSKYLEAYRRLRTALLALQEQQPFRSLLVASASPDEGKTSVVLNLGVLMAQTGLRVSVIDGDFAHPSFHHHWHLAEAPGLTDACVGDVAPPDLLQATELPTLTAVTAGSMTEAGADLASGSAMPRVLQALAELSDLTILDSAPVLGYAGTLQLARMAEAVVLVARARDHVEPVRQALRLLRDVGREVRGIVLNDVLEQDAITHSYYYAAPPR